MQPTVLITGASRGIGRATALAFGRSGYRVAINYHHSADAAQTLAGELTALGCDADTFCADVSQSDAVAQMVDAVERRFGRIDVLINNAGIAGQLLLNDITDVMWEKMIGVNLSGTFYCCRAVLPQMIRRQQGCMINVSSIWGLCGGACEVHYSAAKAGVIGLTKALAKEVAPSKIRVNCIAPGVIDTEMNAALGDETLASVQEGIPLGRFGTAEEIGELMVYLASDQAQFITGQVISPNGGMVI